MKVLVLVAMLVPINAFAMVAHDDVPRTQYKDEGAPWGYWQGFHEYVFCERMWTDTIDCFKPAGVGDGVGEHFSLIPSEHTSIVSTR